MKNTFENLGENIDLNNPGELLRAVAKYSSRTLLAPLESFERGTFGDNGELTIVDGCVVLIRFAEDESHLIKGGESASVEALATSFGGSAVHLSANLTYHPRSGYSYKGEFRIPVNDFLELAKNQQMQLGAVDQQEVVIGGDIVRKYLCKTENVLATSTAKKPSDLPGEIHIEM